MYGAPSRVARRALGLALVAIGILAFGGTAGASAAAFPQCPAVGLNTGCAILVSVNADGTTSVQADPTPPNNGAYDGEDDTLVGFVNNANYSISAITLTSSTLPIFGFDGDGICDPGLGGSGPDPGCPLGSSATQSYVPESAGGTGYEGPNNTFIVSPENSMTGVVDFIKEIPTGGTAYFALEDTLTAADVTVGSVLPGGPPIVTITKGPAHETTSSKATFNFFGVPGGTYECSIDGGPFKPCVSGQTYKGVSPGDHLFQVRETLAGVTGPAASYIWTVDIPKQCVLRVARARVFVFTAHNKIRLVIHYTSWKSAKVTVSYKLKGKKGSLSLGSATQQFHKKGVFRLPELEGAADMAKVRGAKLFTVHFKISGVPKSCGRFYTKKLTIPKKIEKQTVWFQSDSKFTA